MALIICKDCKKEVSSKAKACPNCGNTALEETLIEEWSRVGSNMSDEESKKAIRGVTITLIVCVVFGIWFYFWLSR